MWKNNFYLRISAFCVTRTLWNSVPVRHYGDTKNIECHVRLNAKGWIKIEFHQNSVYYIKYKVAIKTLYMIWYMTNWVSSMTQQIKICLQCKRHGFNSWVRKIPWRSNWQPTPVFLPEKKSYGQRRRLVTHRPRGHKELDTTEQVNMHLRLQLIDILCSSSFSLFLLFPENLFFWINIFSALSSFSELICLFLGYFVYFTVNFLLKCTRYIFLSSRMCSLYMLISVVLNVSCMLSLIRDPKSCLFMGSRFIALFYCYGMDLCLFVCFKFTSWL